MARFCYCFSLFLFAFTINPCFAADEIDEFSIIDSDFLSTHGDYSPPSPPPPPLPPLPPSLSCGDLNGVGTLDTLCELHSSVGFRRDVYIAGNGSLRVFPEVILSCPFKGCSITIDMSRGEFSLGRDSRLSAGTLYITARNASFSKGSVVNVSGLAGQPPAQTSGTPSGIQGAGGGHGGRGASCVTDNMKLPDDVWGGDAYSWSSLDKPWSYGSKGGTTSKDKDYGGEGGGRIRLEMEETIEVGGSMLANGGDGGVKGGGGSGGSIYIKAHRMTGSGWLSATGGNGFAGGGGGRISIDVFSRHDDTDFLIHGGKSFGCPDNAGAAGTYYDAVPQSLIVSNHNMSTNTDTLLMEFPKQPLWTNVYLRDHAKASVPLLWSRVQVRGQIRLSCGAVLSFGLAHFASSEFELMAEELLMSDSVVKANGGADAIVATSLLEASNLVVLRESSVIHSNANLGVHGQGFLNLSGPGDMIEAQRLILSLFYSIKVGPGSILRGPLENASDNDMTPRLYCEFQDCPIELLHPPEDCNVNSSLSFTFRSSVSQIEISHIFICRVEDINIEGIITGSVVHFHWVRTVVVHSSGEITTSALGFDYLPLIWNWTAPGCTGGVGRGTVLQNGLAGGGGHGGKGGEAYYDGSFIEGGVSYGDADLPCELGSGSGNTSLAGATGGGGIIVMGSLEHSLSSLFVYGSLRADGESFGEVIRKQGYNAISNIGPGGGSGGTILLFVHSIMLADSSVISTAGGHGSPSGAGGGGGGRVHFHWSDIPTGDLYQPIATVKGSINTRGGFGRGQGHTGENGTITGKVCPKGLYGIFCEECPLGTFKNVSGSDRVLCHKCPANELPSRGIYVNVRGGVTDRPCPYKCISDRYHMPHCYTALEELVYTFGGPWFFGLILLGLLILLALVLSVARMKYVGADELPPLMPAHRGSQIDHSFPFLESLNEVLETNRTEESQSHVHRMYFMGPNTFTEPWHLPLVPPEQLIEIVYEDAFKRFVDEVNDLAAYQWWEGSIYTILSIVAYPLAWSWLQQCRKRKLQQLREFVRSEYDHSCLRSCRSRALYEGLKLKSFCALLFHAKRTGEHNADPPAVTLQVAATADLMLAYVDFFLGGDEKRGDLPPSLHQRFPMSLVFGGDGSYMAPFSLQSDNILTSLMSQCVPPTIWYRLVAGLNSHLRLVRYGHLKLTFGHVISWLETHANPTLTTYGVRVDLAWFQPTSSGYCQFGLMVSASCNESVRCWIEGQGRCFPTMEHSSWRGPSRETRLVALEPMYSISLLDFILVLFILPFAIFFPFPAGISALFSHGPRRSASLARVYALWNITSLINVIVAFVCGFLHYWSHSSRKHVNMQSWNFSMDESEWWMLPSGLVVCKIVQARLIDCHVANQEIQDHSLYSTDPDVFWQS
ncbi:putative zinc protease PqqL-like [Hibiscus syriacus]|uniref:Zinc protease PqqL-like n=1 Tax=Hibiscus syriacus TaxID=106335 RepID=A0A6A3AMN8_HIBSY|nr:putative zinc protease PqqL-like [Hibiscus syriacus]